MIIALSQYLSEDLIVKSQVITKLSEDLGSFFINKNYGNALHKIVIGIICVNPVFEKFFKPRKPMYTKDKEVREIDIPIEVEKCLEFDIKLGYEDFRNVGNEESLKLVGKAIVASIPMLDKIRIDDFDVKSFKADLMNFLTSSRIIASG